MAEGYGLRKSMNIIAGTEGKDATPAANIWAGTEGLALAGALNAAIGRNGFGEKKAMNWAAGTDGLALAGAAEVLALGGEGFNTVSDTVEDNV
jgi:hypothetical protein